MFTNPADNKFAMPEQQKQIYATKMAENPRPPIPEQKPIIDFKYYPPPPQPKPRGMFQKPDVTNFLPTYGTAPYLPGPMDYYRQQLAGQQLNQIAGIVPPIINYQINTAGPTDLNEHVYMIYEDYLPSKNNIESTYQSIGERMNLQNFIRSTIFNNKDGNNISLDGSGTNSILSHIKFDELNPYNKHRYTNNPFTELPDNFLIYRSCYPIRKSQQGSDIVCAKDATAVNIRLYRMLEGSYNINRNGKTNFADYDEWRDLAFYEYVREEIIRNKMCPNFTIIYGYFISEKSKINYAQINQMKNKNNSEKKEPENIFINSNQQQLNTKIFEPVTNLPATTNYQQGHYEPNPNAYLGKSLVIITESPTYNLISWASNLYQKDGNIKRMINRGSHSKEEWTNILFQLMVALYAMEKTGIYIENFSLINNVYIKDLTLKGQVTNYWKYTIDSIDYYLPNLGYLVLIDSNFVDKKDNTPQTLLQSTGTTATATTGTTATAATTTATTGTSAATTGTTGTSATTTAAASIQTNKPEAKIGGLCLGKYNKLNQDAINKKVFDMFKKSFDDNNFGKDFEQMGGAKIPSEIKTLLNDIKNTITKDTNTTILPYFITYMKQYTHNRIGTLLKESELPNVRSQDVAHLINTNKGMLALQTTNGNTYKVVLVCSEPVNTMVKILSNKIKNLEDISISSLAEYSNTEKIQQTFKPNEASMNEEDLLETYIL